jgi:hypothetical protein
MKKASTHVFETETDQTIEIKVTKTEVHLRAVNENGSSIFMTHDEFREFADEIGKIFTPIRKRRATTKSPEAE